MFNFINIQVQSKNEICYTNYIMQKKRKDKSFLKKPYYEGGLKAMRKFISDHLKYPPEAVKNKIEGTVYLRYEINYKGKVLGAKVISSLEQACDREAIRLVKLLKFKVEKPRGIKVKYFKTIQIHFRNPAAHLPKTKKTIKYHITKNSTSKESGNNSGYNYTISY